jgi:hypothetical protein
MDQAFWAQVDRTSGCWLWTGPKNNHGYGRVGPNLYVHRLAYEQLVGQIPDGLQLDHLCNVRHCVNPAHLEPVTKQENLRRGRERRAQETHCRNGHPWAENGYVSGQPYRRCRACARAADARRVPRKRSAA